MYLYIITLHLNTNAYNAPIKPTTFGNGHIVIENLPLQRIENRQNFSCYRLVISDIYNDSIGPYLGEYYNKFIFKNDDISIDVTVCEFPETFSEEEILQANPIKINKPFYYKGHKTNFYELTTNAYELGNNNLNKSIDGKKLAKFYQSLSAFKMQEAVWSGEDIEASSQPLETNALPLPMDTMFSNLTELDLEKNDVAPIKKKEEYIYFVKMKKEYEVFDKDERIIFIGPLTPYVETPFCEELQIVKKINTTFLSESTQLFNDKMFNNKIIEKNELESLLKGLFTDYEEKPRLFVRNTFGKDSINNKEDNTHASNKEAIMKRLADSIGKSIKDIVGLPSSKTDFVVSEEGIEFLWYYVTLNPYECSLRNFFQYKTAELYSKTPSWWNDTATKVYMTKYFQTHKDEWFKPGVKYTIRILSDFRALIAYFYTAEDNYSSITDYSALYEALFNTKNMSEEAKVAWVKAFARNNLIPAEGQVAGSQSTYKKFLAWINDAPLWNSVKEALQKVFPITEFSAKMKEVGYTTTRRKQGNVYLDVKFARPDVEDVDGVKEVKSTLIESLKPVQELGDNVMDNFVNAFKGNCETPSEKVENTTEDISASDFVSDDNVTSLDAAFQDVSGSICKEDFLQTSSTRNGIAEKEFDKRMNDYMNSREFFSSSLKKL